MVISLLALRSALHTRHRLEFQPPMKDCSAPAAPKPSNGYVPLMNCWSVNVLPPLDAFAIQCRLQPGHIGNHMLVAHGGEVTGQGELGGVLAVQGVGVQAVAMPGVLQRRIFSSSAVRAAAVFAADSSVFASAVGALAPKRLSV
jgi:hypothetical protein